MIRPGVAASAFTTEMADLGHVVRVARRRFLVLLDEIGRSTSTSEGLCIAWAVAERLADIRCPTILATHFTALTNLPASIASVCNLHMGAIPVHRGLAFEYAVLPGPCSVVSYGLTLATMVGFPSALVERALQFQQASKIATEPARQAPPPHDAAAAADGAPHRLGLPPTGLGCSTTPHRSAPNPGSQLVPGEL